VTDLLEETARLVAIASVSRDEQAIADVLEQELRAQPHLTVDRIGDNLVARTETGAPERLVLAGHLDTVPAADNETPRIEGDVLHGLGSADMKGGLAVMASLAHQPATAALDYSLVFYVCEEIARAHSGLLAIVAAKPELLAADAAILLEPTSAIVEAGCQGVVRVTVRIGGHRAHTARPWTGVNAIHRAAELLDHVGAYPERLVTLDGCEYHETLQAVRISGGVAGNVVPDEVQVTLSHRFAPDRDTEGAYAALETYLSLVLDESAGDSLMLDDSAPAAPPALDHPLLSQVVKRTGESPKAKLGWTDVAFFHERNVPALNLGPGDGLLAHTPGEFVTRADLDAVRAILADVLFGAS
jgi:succinyl-diaminopimelate desuccinylase